VSSLATAVAVTALAWLLVFGVFIVLMRRRWLARYRSGFFLSLLFALVGIAMMSASVVGVWGFEAAKQLLDRQLTTELEDIGGILQNQVAEDIAGVSRGLRGFGAGISPLLARHAPAAELEPRLRLLQSFDRLFLQGGFACREMPQRPLRGHAKEFTCYEVISVTST